MAFIKNVEITVRSVIENLTSSGAPDGEPEITETTAPGFMHFDNEQIRLTYSEATEGGKVFTEITSRDGQITVKRHGAIESEMVFAEGKSHDSLYSVVPYAFDVTVKARKIRNSLTKSGGALDVFYDMHIGGADKNVRMKLTVKEMPTTA